MKRSFNLPKYIPNIACPCRVVASDCLELSAALLAGADSAQLLKLIIQCFCSIYPLLFRVLQVPFAYVSGIVPNMLLFPFSRCSNRTNRLPWDVLMIAKRRIIEFVESPASGAKAGVRLASLKFIQRVILVQTRGISDPRVSIPATLPSDYG